MDTTGRDHGLHRVSALTRWSLGGAVALTGVFSALVAHARPGHAKSISTTATPTTATTVPDNGGGFLQPPPAGPPARGSGGGIVRSGAS